MVRVMFSSDTNHLFWTMSPRRTNRHEDIELNSCSEFTYDRLVHIHTNIQFNTYNKIIWNLITSLFLWITAAVQLPLVHLYFTINACWDWTLMHCCNYIIFVMNLEFRFKAVRFYVAAGNYYNFIYRFAISVCCWSSPKMYHQCIYCDRFRNKLNYMYTRDQQAYCDVR